MGEEKGKVRKAFYIEEELLVQADGLLQQADARSRNEFLNQALKFYIGYLTSEKIENYMLSTIASVMHAIVKDSENRMARAMYKLAVEVSKLSHVTAYGHEVDEETLRKLQAKCAEEVKRINETVINPPAELGRLTDAGGGEQSIKIENSAV
jgi:metal-responsive CopG/Arc/MetJ family transcriptional regulator